MPDQQPLSDAQFADVTAAGGGASVGFFTRIPVQGPGFMTAVMGTEDNNDKQPITEADVANFRKENESIASAIPNSAHGSWKTTQDVSIKTKTPVSAMMIGIPLGEEASYALPNTRVSIRGHRAGPKGADVLLHTADLGVNDVDPRYQPGTLDIPAAGSFTRNQYKNADWAKTAGYNAGSPVTYGDLLRVINKNRAMRQRIKIGRETVDSES